MNCQKCRLPLRVDGSIQNLSVAQVELLMGQEDPQGIATSSNSRLSYPAERNTKYEEAALKSGIPLMKRTMPPKRGIVARGSGPQAQENTAMSFVMLQDSQNREALQPRKPRGADSSERNGPGTSEFSTDKPHTLQNIESSSRLFDLLSSRTEVDHPLCTDCTELLLSSLQARLAASLKERDAYAGFLSNLRTNPRNAEELARASKELSEAQDAEEHAQAELIQIENEKLKLEEELAALDEESRMLDLQEQNFWKHRNEFDQKLSSFQDTRDALNASIAHDVHQLARLERTNVYNDTFFISHDGPFGTINGLRLGRLPPPNNVDWPEINAAWGTTILLIATVAERLKLTFDGFLLRPMGSTSHLEKIGSGSQADQESRGSTKNSGKPVLLELYSSGDLPLGRQILHRRFNEAMVAFLECLRQLCEHIKLVAERSQGTAAVTLPPYDIDKDKINGVSIKLGVSQDESWTTACKYTLTCCKFLLAHISNIS